MASTTDALSPTTTEAPPPHCTTAVPDANGYVPPTACNANYGYYPSWEWNLVFAIAFSLTTLVHTVQAFNYRKAFCWVIVMGSLWECACFVLRTLGARDQQNTIYLIASVLLFLLAPLWINAFVYMVLARLVHVLMPDKKALGVPAIWLAKIFVFADILSFGIQATGGSKLADQNDRDNVAVGQKTYMAGIAIQAAFVVIFFAFAVSFQVRLEKLWQSEGVYERRKKWARPLGWILTVALLLILMRIIFRLIEFSGDVSPSNPILSHEAYQLCLDALPMFVALVLLNAVHPGLVLRGPDSVLPPVWKLRSGMSKKNGSEVHMLSVRSLR